MTTLQVKRISELIPPKFHDVWRAALDPDILNVVCKGGRGSGKSSDIAHIMVQLLMRYPANAVAVRKTGNTLEQSVYEQIKWATNEQGVSHLFRFNKSPLKITFAPRGNYMIFRGAQDPERIKSLKDSQFPFAFAWVEELAEFKTEDEVTTITNSLLRGELPEGLTYKFFFSYNPPKRKQSWVNLKYESQFQPANTFVHHSTYKDNPFIAEEFVEEAEAARKRDEYRYRWEYLGEAIGAGIVPFSNLKFERLSTQTVMSFDNVRQGGDFGYGVDPLAFVRLHYDKTRRRIFIFDEIYQRQLSNRGLARILKTRGYDRTVTTFDSAEPKSIAELRLEHGILAEGAKKGPDSVEYGERWLSDLDAIIIDPERCPHTAREFELIDFQVDRDGNPKNRLEDDNNHAIDATRYALEQDMRAKNQVKLFRGGI